MDAGVRGGMPLKGMNFIQKKLHLQGSERGRNMHLLRDQKPEIKRQNYALKVRLLKSAQRVS